MNKQSIIIYKGLKLNLKPYTKDASYKVSVHIVMKSDHLFFFHSGSKNSSH